MCFICRKEPFGDARRLDICCKDLTRIPALPVYVTDLIIRETKISHLPHLHQGLISLAISECHSLVFTSPLPSSLESLHIFFCEKLENLQLPKNLRSFTCNYCPIQELSELPPNLTNLDVSNCVDLSCIPTLPDSLIYYRCGRTKIKELKKLPPNLRELFISNTRISYIPPLPNTLLALCCDRCPISSLPELPDSLDHLMAGYTNITKLPPLPPNLRRLWCNDTLIESIPHLPQSFYLLNCVRCRRLLILPVPVSGMFFSQGCPWVERGDPMFSSRLEKVKKLQKFFKERFFFRKTLVKRHYLKRHLPKELVEMILTF